MTRREQHDLHSLEGRTISVALADGSRLDDAVLVSAGRSAVDTVWVFINGDDRFIPVPDIASVWERFVR